MNKNRHPSTLAALGLLAALAGPAQAVVSAGDPADWVVAPGAMNGLLDGVGRVLYTDSSGAWACSGTLLAGGLHVATAAHCADEFTQMTVRFREGEVVRNVASASVLPQWSGWNGTGTDIALLTLDSPVTGITGFRISTTSNLYQDYLLAGYGFTGTGSVGGNLPNSPARLHHGYNTWDTTDDALNLSVFGNNGGGTSHGVTYVSDFDDGSDAHNTLWQETFYGSKDASSTGLGLREAFMTGGDSGGGNFVWNGQEWLLAGVHATGWVICDCFDANTAWFGSFGELNEATAVYTHAAWIAGIAGAQVLPTAAVPEPAAGALMAMGLAGLLGLARARRRPTPGR